MTRRAISNGSRWSRFDRSHAHPPRPSATAPSTASMHERPPSPRPHVGIVLPDLGGGGAERATLTLAASLIDRGYRVDLVLLRLSGQYRATMPDGMAVYYHRSRTPDREFAGYCRERGIDLRMLPTGPLEAVRAWWFLRRRFPRIGDRLSRVRAALGVARYIREAEPQLLFSALHLANDGSVLAAALTGRTVPVVVSLRSNIGVSYSQRQKAFARLLTPEADAVVAVSQGVAADAVETLGLDARLVHPIYNPKPLGDIRRLAQEAVDHTWFEGGEPPVILAVLRWGRQKDWPTLVEAFGHVRRGIPARLAILGHLSEANRHELMAFADSFGVAEEIAFLGFDENPFRYMRRAALFVLSSRSEGLPNVLIEAMACGTPVVSTDAPFGPTEILEGGRWGRLTPVGDAPALAQAIVETLAGESVPADALRRRADDFSAERAVAAYESLFEKLIRRNARDTVAERGLDPS